MYCIVGAPRTGTSLICQTLDLLGVPMAAPKFIEEHDNIREFNPKGFYELDWWGGVKDDRFKDKAIKLFGFQFYMTDEKYITKVIHTTRNRHDAIASYEKMRPLLKHNEFTSEVVYDSNEFYIKEKLKTVDSLGVEFEAIKQNPSIFVDALIVYLGINPTDEQITNAKNNIQCQ